MKRSIFVMATILAALVLGVPTASPDVGVQNVNLSCNDGTNLNLALDPTSLTALTGAVGAIGLFPAGDPALACGLSQTDPPPPGSGNPNTDYAVGGGRATLFRCDTMTVIPNETNFALEARVDAASNGTAGTGTFNVTIPQSESAVCPVPPPGNQEGHWNAKIDCVHVISPTMAEATFKVIRAEGRLSSFEGRELRVDVFDGRLSGTDDLIRIRVPTGKCDFTTPFSATRTVDNGNITVHQAQ
jgi:hypothetical protein